MTDYSVLINCIANKGRSPGLTAYCNYFAQLEQIPGLRFESAGINLEAINKLKREGNIGISKRVGLLLEGDGIPLNGHVVRYAGDLVHENFRLVLATDREVQQELVNLGFGQVELAKRFAGLNGDDIFDAHDVIRYGKVGEKDPRVDAAYVKMVQELKTIARRIVNRLEGVV
jgi:hypothetical protein